MKRLAFCTVLYLSCMAVPALAAEDPRQTAQQAVGTFVQGCEKELAAWCKEVTPGEGRLLACLYAHQDKLSPRCEYALYDSAAQLQRALNAVTYTASECGDDLKSTCAEVKPGEGRLLDCLRKNEARVSTRCRTALKDVGLQ